MKTIPTVAAILMGAAVALSPKALAFREADHASLPEIDKRLAPQGTPAAQGPARTPALENLRGRLPQARVDFDLVTGAPKRVSAPNNFLTGPNGKGRGVSAVVAAEFMENDPHRAAKAFLKEHRALFGHGPETLERARIKRDYVTPHNGLRTVVWEQQVDGVPVFEGVFIAHTTKRGELVNVSSQFVPEPEKAADQGVRNRKQAQAAPTIPLFRAVALAAANLGNAVAEEQVTVVEPAADARPLTPALSPDGEGARRADEGDEEASKARDQWQRLKINGLKGDSRARLVWLPLSAETLRLCWEVTLTDAARGESFRVLVDAQSGEVWLRRCLTKYSGEATYRVFVSDSPSPFSPGHFTPSTNQPPTVPRTLVTLAALATNASPRGWIDAGSNETRGNNVDAHLDRNADNQPDLPRPQGAPFRVFDFPMDLSQPPQSYSAAAVVQAFYVCNWAHDRLWDLGFTEAAGNFQNDNFGRGGQGNDAVSVDVQDGSGYNNANIYVPPDGAAPRIQMYLWNGPTPNRDSALDTEILIHEYVHGLSDRLVGGGVGLYTLQAGGLGEGWSDWYALTLLSESGDDPGGGYAKGGYATYLLMGHRANYYFGIRRYPYSTNLAKHPLTFKDIDAAQASPHAGVPRSSLIDNAAAEVHNMGEVWCVTLWEARANLIAKHGFAAGNELALQLVTDGLKLTPPNPNYVEARDAILLADQVLTGGANGNELWAAFAKRGLGASATSPPSTTSSGVQEAFDLPDDLLIAPPVGFVAVGPAGGPLAPASLTFTLTNDGPEDIPWTAAASVPWLDLSSSQGKLLVAGPAQTVVIALNAAATSLPAGLHDALVCFTNLASGQIFVRRFVAQVDQPPFSDDFEPDIDRLQWSQLGVTPLANTNGGSVSASNSLWFEGNGIRLAVTRPLNTVGGGTLEFFLRLADGFYVPWDAPELPWKGVVLEYSTDGGSHWLWLASYTTPEYQTWRLNEVVLPVAAQTAYTLFRWRQLAFVSEAHDHWAIDDVALVIGPRPPRVALAPADQTVALGSRAIFSVVATGSKPLALQWRKDGLDLPGATGTNLIVAGTQFGDAGAYSVRVTNEFGVTFSASATLTVVELGRNFFDDFDPDMDGPQWMVLSGNPQANRFGGSVSTPNSLWFGGDGPRLAVTRPLDVSCGGTIEFCLHVGDDDGWPWEAINFPNEAIVLEFSTDGGVGWTEVVRYDTYADPWRKLTLDIPSGAQTANTLFRWRQLAHSGSCCDHWALDNVTVTVVPHIIQQPLSLTVPAGQAAGFSVAATGAGPLTYQWRKDGADIPGATGTNFTILNTQTNDAGSYSVRVVNTAGATLSVNAVLRVVASNAFVVAVFSDASYFMDVDSRLAYVSASLEQMGFVTVPFADFAEAAQYSTVLIPALDVGDLGADLTVETRAALSNHVVRGASLVVLGSHFGQQSKLLNATFDLALQEYWPDAYAPIYWRTAQAADTEFADDAVSLPPNAITTPLQTPSLPWGTRSVYENMDQTSVALIEWGHGFIVYLGWNWDGAIPLGAQDEGWLNVLASAVLQKDPLPPRPPVIALQPQSRTVAPGLDVTLTVGAYGSWPLAYRWRRDGVDITGATNTALAFPEVTTSQTGLYDVVVTNPHGAITSTIAALTVVELPASLEFQLVTLGTNHSRVVDCAPWTGDDRGGLAVSTTHVFCTGDDSTARFALADLSGGAALGDRFEALIGDLQSGTVYSLAQGQTPLGWGGMATSLLEHDGATGLTNGVVIPLSQPIPLNMSTEAGLFAGYGCLVIHNGETVYAILLPSGQVVELGPMSPPRHHWSESWAYWGVAECLGGKVHLVYVQNPQTIVRTSVPDGLTTPVATFDDLADMASFSVSIPQGRWYFHHQWPGQFGSAAETLGYADAAFNIGSTNPPVVLIPPANRDAVTGDTITFLPTYGGSAPRRFQWQKDDMDLVGATNAHLALAHVQTNDAGRYRVRVINAFGEAVSPDAQLTVTPAGQAIAVFADPAYVRADGYPWFGAESVPASLRSRGFAATTFTDLETAVTLYRGLVIPALDLNDLAMDMPATTRQAVSNFVAQGGTLVVHGNWWPGPASRVLNAVFGWSIQETHGYPGNCYDRTSEVLGTGFADDPLNLQAFADASVLPVASLPPEARSLYERQGESVVALMGVGRGTVVFLGWSWANAAPLGDRDDGWLDVLASAVTTSAPLPPLPPVIAAHPEAQTNVTGTQVTLRVTARGTAPLRYQWQRDGVDLPGATNDTLILARALPADTAAYRVQVANDVGELFSDEARLEIRPLEAVVAVFDDPRYVDTSGGRYAESDTVQASLRHLGFLTATFTNLEAAAGTYHRLLFPCLRGKDLAQDLTPASRSALSNFVAQGGALIVLGSVFEYPARLLNSVFGLAVQREVNPSPSFARTLQTTGTEFENEAMELPQNSFTMPLVTGSLPPHARSLYESKEQTAVALIEWGHGVLLFLGWSWNDAEPLGQTGGDWLGVLASAARQEGNLPPLPPLMDLQPQSQTVAAGTYVRLHSRAAGTWPLHYQWRYNGTDLAGATNADLILASAATTQSGAYDVIATNAFGVVTSAVATLTIFAVPPTEEFQILSLSADFSTVIEHTDLTGDDRGGIAASTLQVFYTGDEATARFDLNDLSGGTALSARYDAMVGDLRSGTVYSLADGLTPLDSSGGIVTSLLVHDNRTGFLHSGPIPLSSSIRLTAVSQVGLFAGYGRIVVHDGSRVYDILLPSGYVVDRGPLAPLDHSWSETWAYWGVAEYVGGNLSLVYVRDQQTIVRAQVPAGITTTVARFKNIYDMSAFTVSVPLGRWYFHYEDPRDLRERTGFADARFLVGATQPPVILSQPRSQTVVAGKPTTFSVSAAGSTPLSYQWQFNGVALAGATNAILRLDQATPADAGTYSVAVRNASGNAISSNVTLTVLAAGAGSVAVLAAEPFPAWNEDVRDKLAAWGFFERVDVLRVTTYDPVPLLEELLAYNAVLVYSDGWFNDQTAMGDLLADYLDLGGGVVMAAFAFGEGKRWGIEGRIKTDGYLPFTTGGHMAFEPLVMVVDEPLHPIMEGVLDFVGGSASYHHTGITTNPGALLLAHWDNLDALVAAKEAGSGRIVGLNFFPPSSDTGNYSWLSDTDGARLMANALLWVAQGRSCTPTIAAQPAPCTQVPGGTARVEVVARGAMPLSYAWWFKGSPVPGATTATLTLPNVQPSDAGDCYVVISNSCGAVTSHVATLTVIQPAGVAGYFTDHDSAATGLDTPIRLAGYTPVRLTDIAGQDLNSLRLLMINEFDNSTVSPALLARWPDIQNWVSHGGKLVVHDRSAGSLWPNPFLPGPAATNTHRLMAEDLDVVRPGDTLVTAGPFGDINDRMLDRGNFSAHGWVAADMLPPGARAILCMDGHPNQVAAFSWQLGRGVVYYSTIPLDCFLDGGDCVHSPICAVLQTNYTPNVLLHVDFAVPGLPPLRLQPPQPSGNGDWHLWLGQADGSLMTPERAAHIRVRGATNLALPFDAWPLLANPLQFTNGRLRLDGLSITNPPQLFLRAVENP